jgi:hypothetical protein
MLHFEILKGSKEDVERSFEMLQKESGVQVIDWKFETQISSTDMEIPYGSLIYIIAVRYRKG